MAFWSEMSLRRPKSTHVHVIRTPSSVLEVRTSKKAAGGNDGSLSSLGRRSSSSATTDAGRKARLNSYLPTASALLYWWCFSLALRQTDSRIRKGDEG